MQHLRIVPTLAAGGLLLALAGGCAAPAKTAKPSTDVNDGAASAQVAKAEPVVAPKVEPAPPSCSLARVHFGFDSSQLDDSAREALKEAAACLQQRRPADVVIEGHCDERGTEAYNVALGNRRAGAVKTYLADLGVRFPLQAISFGKSLPLARGEGEAIWSQNRRAELKLPGEKRTDGTVVAGR